MVNVWTGQYSGQFAAVYSVTMTQDPSQGEFVVGMQNLSYYPSPQAVGAMTITAVNAPVVQFTYAGGSGTFNMVTGAYTFQ